MAPTYPRSLTFALNALLGVSKNVIKRNCDTTSAVQAGTAPLQMRFPVNTWLDWTSAWLYTQASTPSGYVIPRDTTSLIESRSISARGYGIEQPCQKANVIHNGVSDYLNWNKTPLRSVIQNGGMRPTQPAPVYTSPASFAATTAYNTTVPATTAVPTNNIDTATSAQWIGIPLGGESAGLLSSSSTKIVPHAHLPEMLLTLQLAGPQVLVSTSGSGTASTGVTFTNSSYSIDAYSFNDGFYDALIEAKVNSAEGLEINFYQWSCHAGATNQKPCNNNGQISTQSLNMVVGTLIPTTYGSGTANTMDTTTYQSQYFTRKGSGVDTTQILINSIPYPLLQLHAHETFVETCKSLSLNNDLTIQSHEQLNSLSNFQNHFFMYALRLCLESDDGSAFMSGLNTLGNNGNIELHFTPTSGASANYQQLIFCQATKTLQIFAGKNINVVQ